jgi:hypothetical protein
MVVGRAAAIYSLPGTAKLNGIDPDSYLRSVMSRIVDQPIGRIEELLPSNGGPDSPFQWWRWSSGWCVCQGPTAVPMMMVSSSAAMVCFTFAGTNRKLPTA